LRDRISRRADIDFLAARIDVAGAAADEDNAVAHDADENTEHGADDRATPAGERQRCQPRLFGAAAEMRVRLDFR
jgi:hypothetical protein